MPETHLILYKKFWFFLLWYFGTDKAFSCDKSFLGTCINKKNSSRGSEMNLTSSDETEHRCEGVEIWVDWHFL